MPEIVIFTTQGCAYCIAAKRLLAEKGRPFKETDLTGKDGERAALERRTGHLTVPQIFIDGKFIGGYEELAALLRTGVRG